MGISITGNVSQDLELIRQTLGESYVTTWTGAVGNDLGRLCLSGRINPVSKHKPVISGLRTRLTEQQRQELNYGHTMTPYSTPGAMMAAVMNNENFPYSRPLGGESSPFRGFDFDGYDHAIQYWYNFDPDTTVVDENGIIEFSADIKQIFDDCRGALGAYSPDDPKINFGFVVKSGQFLTTPEQSMYWYPLTGVQTIADLDKVRISLQQALSPGTYYYHPALTTVHTMQNYFTYYESGQGDGTWWPYPFCSRKSVVIQDSVAPNPARDYISVEVSSSSVSSNTAPSTLYDLTIRVHNKSSEDISSAAIEVRVRTAISSTGWLYSSKTYRFENLLAGESRTMTLTWNTKIEEGSGGVEERRTVKPASGGTYQWPEAAGWATLGHILSDG